MNIQNRNIDNGKAFDWGRASSDYAKFRDIYPQEFYDRIVNRKLCIDGQSVLDLGTGTGVLPRNMYRFGAKWTGTDISENQIAEARKLSQGMDIEYHVAAAEQTDFPDASFDVITACQCFWYFDHKKIMPGLYRMLKENGRVLVLYMAWLPFEDKIAGESEKLVLKYNPQWSGCGEMMHPIRIPECYGEGFKLVYHEEYTVNVTFTRESWHGRMKACRGVGASMTAAEVSAWEKEHFAMLGRIAPPEFEVRHYGAIAELCKI